MKSAGSALRVLVSGGAGFIGRAVIAALEGDGHQVLTYDSRSGCDILDSAMLRERMAGCDVALHLAGVLGTDELFDEVHRAIDVNVHGTANVLDACVAVGAGYVGVTMLPIFPSIYAATKVCATRLASAYHRVHGLPVCHVRAYNAYGPGQAHGPGHPRKIIPALSVEGWAGAPLRIFGNGDQGVDLIHVSEIAVIFADAIAIGDDSTIDAGSGWAMTVNEVADVVLEVTGSRAGVVHLPMRRGEIPQRIRATGEGWGRLRRHSGLVATEPPLERLAATIESYRDHPAAGRS